LTKRSKRKANTAQENGIKKNYFPFSNHWLFQNNVAKNKLIITKKEYYLPV
jgi:hypothetical protein